jgi:hypothetical protein
MQQRKDDDAALRPAVEGPGMERLEITRLGMKRSGIRGGGMGTRVLSLGY